MVQATRTPAKAALRAPPDLSFSSSAAPGLSARRLYPRHRIVIFVPYFRSPPAGFSKSLPVFVPTLLPPSASVSTRPQIGSHFLFAFLHASPATDVAPLCPMRGLDPENLAMLVPMPSECPHEFVPVASARRSFATGFPVVPSVAAPHPHPQASVALPPASALIVGEFPRAPF